MSTVGKLKKYLSKFNNDTQIDVACLHIYEDDLHPVMEPLNLSFKDGNIKIGNDGKVFLQIGVIKDKREQPKVIIEPPKDISNVN